MFLEPYSLLSIIAGIFILITLILKKINKNHFYSLSLSSFSAGLFSIGTGCYLFAAYMISQALYTLKKHIPKYIYLPSIFIFLTLLFIFISEFNNFGLYPYYSRELYSILFFLITIIFKKLAIKNNYIFCKYMYFLSLIFSYYFILEWTYIMNQNIFTFSIISFLFVKIYDENKKFSKNII